MARVELVEAEGTEVSRVWKTAPGLGDSLQPVLATMYDSSKLLLTPRVREAARMRIAVHNGCAVCQSHRNPEYAAAGVTEDLYEHVTDPSHPEYSAPESLAIEYADLFARDHQAITEAFFIRLREQFSDPEIVELTMLLAVWLGLGRLTRTLDVDHACAVEAAGSGGPR